MKKALLSAAVLAASGCTFGLGDQVTFATRNLSVEGELASGTFASTDGTVQVVPLEVDVTRGVMIFIDGRDEERALTSRLRFDGNLGALCPGSRVELEGEGVLRAVAQSGAPLEMLDQLSRLSLDMQTVVSAPEAGEELRPSRVVVESAESTGSFSLMRFASTSIVDGEERTVTGSFEIARVVEEAEVPGWEGDTWEGQPIENWE